MSATLEKLERFRVVHSRIEGSWWWRNVQVVDTVELFHARNARKLSLRFLASYLLNLDIQAVTHDSITDARTALQLFQVCLFPTALPTSLGIGSEHSY